MKILLECGVDPMRRDWYGQTALHTAAIGLDPELYDDDEQQQQQQIAVIQLLYEYGGDELLQATTSHEQETALHLAVFSGDIVEKLLELALRSTQVTMRARRPYT
eukprot:10014-Heterococcus_DN1.PRE.5